LGSSDARIDSILADGRALLAAGSVRDAALAFERALLLEPDHARAREALDVARAALAEERRALDAQLEQARGLFAAGDLARARILLEHVIEHAGDRDAARALLDRCEEGGAAVFAFGAALVEPAPARALDRSRRPAPRTRRVLALGWTVLLAAFLGAFVSNWDELVARLTATPAPRSRLAPPSTSYPAPSAGERALAEARTRLEQGDAEGARAALLRVPPEDPAFPFATQLRAQAERAQRPASAHR